MPKHTMRIDRVNIGYLGNCSIPSESLALTRSEDNEVKWTILLPHLVGISAITPTVVFLDDVASSENFRTHEEVFSMNEIMSLLKGDVSILEKTT